MEEQTLELTPEGRALQALSHVSEVIEQELKELPDVPGSEIVGGIRATLQVAQANLKVTRDQVNRS